MTLEYRVGDVFDRLREIPDGSIDLIVTSPPIQPFLALRSYLPADHPDKAREIGSEATPADFLDTLLALSAEFGRVLAPHGSLCVELGDTFSSLGGVTDGRVVSLGGNDFAPRDRRGGGTGWPLAKSLTGIPTLYPWSLAYGRNLLTGQPSPAGQWRIRNVIVWARPNPPVGALGDKFRPATSYITVACRGAKRYFDLDAVRTEHQQPDGWQRTGGAKYQGAMDADGVGPRFAVNVGNPAGAPPLDWHADQHPEDGDWLWKMSTQPYSGSFTTTRRVPCGPDDGGERIASASCLRHGDLPGQVPKALRDAHADSTSNRTQRNGHHHAPTLDLDGAATDATPDRSDSAHAQTTATLVRECDPVAIAHSTPVRRTGRAPATTQPDTPSARKADGTARTSTSPESSGPCLDTDESSNGSVDSGASLAPRTALDTADIPRSERPCTCSYEKVVTESSSHYATFPMALPKRLIEAMCPLRVCTVCGRPSERIVGEAEYVSTNGGRVVNQYAGERRNGATNQWTVEGGNPGHAVRSAPTLGWSDCGHDAWRTGVTLDPFAGSGTTLEAAQAVGRHAIGIDLDPRNADLARSRVGMFMTVDAPDEPTTQTTPHNSTGNPRFRVGYVRTSGGAPDRRSYGEPA